MPVLPNSGPSWAEAALTGFDRGAKRRRAEDLFQQQIQDAQYTRGKQRLQDEAAGVHIMAPGEALPATVSQNIIDYAAQRGNEATVNPMVSSSLSFSPEGGKPTLSRAGAGAANAPGAPSSFRDKLAAMVGGSPDRGAQYQFTKGVGYTDRAPQWQQQDAATAKTQAEKLFEANIAASLADQSMGRDVTKAGLLAPIDVQKAIDTERGVGPLRTQNAIATAAGTAPIEVGKAIATERGVGPLRTQNAIATAAGIAPIDISKAVSTASGIAPIETQKAIDISHGTMGDRIAVAGSQNKPATEPERMAAGFGARMVSASKTLNALESDPSMLKTLTGAMGSPGGSGKLPLIGNFTLSRNAQLYQQAQTNWVRANLRKESGAAIGDHEMADEIKNYFPQPGDGPAVIKQKQANRTLAEQNMKKNAGAAWDASMDALLSPSTPSGSGPVGDFNLSDTTATNPFMALPKKTP